LATHIREAAQLDESHTELDEVWFIVSPQNPFKNSADLADENHRLEMVKLAIENVPYFKVLDIEFHLPKPSYTHVTLKELMKQFSTHKFSLIIGEDNVAKFNEWKEVDWILENVSVLVYNRTIENLTTHDSRLTTFNLPLFDISSTEIRKRIKQNLSIKYFVTEKVNYYIENSSLYI
jgi:nicotinate-nucleotide adenylyltransferase